MNPRIINIYQDSYKKKREEQMELGNWYAWIQGQYQMASIAAAIGGRKQRYPQKPFAIFENGTQISGEEKFLLWVEEYNRRFENKEKQNDTERP